MGASKRQNFTHGRVTGFNCPADKKQAFLWDSGVPGLGVRATSGSRSYIFQGTISGSSKKLRITIGAVGALTLKAARDQAQDMARKLAKGIDPRQERKEQAEAEQFKAAQEARATVTMADAWTVYLGANKHRWSERHLFDHERLIDPGGRPVLNGKKDTLTKAGPLAALAPMKLIEIDAEAVKKWLEKEAADRPASAGLSFRLLRAFLNWAAEHPDYQEAAHPEACTARIVKEHLPKGRAKEDCLQKEQVKPWFEAIRKLQNPVISAYLQGLLITGARRNELAPLKWEDVDFHWRSITIHDKVEGSRTIPLTPYLATLLYPLRRESEYVFHSPTAKAGYLAEPRHAHSKACEAAGIEGLTIHGLRRSFGTLSEWVECPIGIVAQIMGHKPSAIAEKHYRHRPLDLLRLWHVKIEGWILAQAGISQPAENAELGKLIAVK